MQKKSSGFITLGTLLFWQRVKKRHSAPRYTLFSRATSKKLACAQQVNVKHNDWMHRHVAFPITFGITICKKISQTLNVNKFFVKNQANLLRTLLNYYTAVDFLRRDISIANIVEPPATSLCYRAFSKEQNMGFKFPQAICGIKSQRAAIIIGFVELVMLYKLN